jgi:hypothetical protein
VDWQGGSEHFAETTFTPPGLLPLVADGESTACVGVLLFYDKENVRWPLHVCAYDNAVRSPVACSYPFNRPATGCNSVHSSANSLGCYDVVYTDDASTPPTALGSLASFVAMVNGKAAWIDPRDPKSGVERAAVYNLSTWFVPRALPVADVENVRTSFPLQSHPKVCVTSLLTTGFSACGKMDNGCMGTLDCGETCPRTGEVCGAQVPNVCSCPPGTQGPSCLPVEYCGTVPMLTSNPCVTLVCVDPATGAVREDPKPDRTSCEDTDLCNGTELCFAGVCTGGVPMIVDDGDERTCDGCVAGAVTHDASCETATCSTSCATKACSDSGVSGLSTDLSTAFKARSDAIIPKLRDKCADCAVLQ